MKVVLIGESAGASMETFMSGFPSIRLQQINSLITAMLLALGYLWGGGEV